MTYNLKKTSKMCLIPVLIHIIQLSCFTIVVRANVHVDGLQIPPNGLGARGTQINVTTLLDWPDTNSFIANYAKPSTPFIIQNAAKDWPAFRKWNDDFFLSMTEGSEERVTVEQAKKEEREKPAEELSFHDFVREYEKKDWYMVEQVPEFLRKDIIMPPAFQCPEMANSLLSQMMWFSSGGTKSVLHFDHMDNIHCLIAGRKLFIMIDPNNKVQIDHPEGSYSSVDVDNVDYSQYPDLDNLDYHLAYLSAGDCLYLPYHWYHQARGADRNIGVNIWWDHHSMMALDHNVCDEVIPRDQHNTMDQFEFKGTGQLLQHVEVVKSYIRLLASQEGTPLTYSRFVFMLLGEEEHRPNLGDNEHLFSVLLELVFTTLDVNHDGTVVPEEIDMLPPEKWLSIQESMESIQQILQKEQEDEFDMEMLDDMEARHPGEWDDMQYNAYDDGVFHDDMDYMDDWEFKDEL